MVDMSRSASQRPKDRSWPMASIPGLGRYIRDNRTT